MDFHLHLAMQFNLPSEQNIQFGSILRADNHFGVAPTELGLAGLKLVRRHVTRSAESLTDVTRKRFPLPGFRTDKILDREFSVPGPL